MRSCILVIAAMAAVLGFSHPAKAQTADKLLADRKYCWETPFGTIETGHEVALLMDVKKAVVETTLFGALSIRSGPGTWAITYVRVPCPPDIEDRDYIFRVWREGLAQPYVEVSVVGGWNSLTGSGKSLTSLDTKAADPIQTQGLSSSSSTGVVGGTVTAKITDLFSGMATNAPLVFETGVLWRTGGDRTDNVVFETFAGGNGTAHDPPKWTVPLLAGLAFPIGMGPNVTAKVAGGVNINRREAGFALREIGAGPAGLPVIASNTWTSVDPALDVGLKVGIGRLGAFPVSVGADVLMDWTRSHTLIAQSPNFLSQSYTMNTGRQMDTMVLFNVSFGLAPAPARPPIVRK